MSGMRQGGSAHGTTWLTQRAVALAKEGDSEGIHYLYVRYAEDVIRYVTSFVRDHHEAEDITQNVFTKLMAVIGKYEQRDVPFDAWILRVARNAALDHLRAKRPVPTEELRIPDPSSAGCSPDEAGEAFREALDELPKDQREVLILRHIVGLSPVEIAATLEKTESSVHGLHHRGRRALRASLVERGVSPVVTKRAAD